MMRHAKGYGVYAKQDGLKQHRVDLYLIEGRAVCICCSYPLAGKFYRIIVPFRDLAKLLKEIRLWGISHTQYLTDKGTVVTSDISVIDVATETFFKHPERLTIELL